MQIYFEFFTCTMVYFAEIQFTYYHKFCYLLNDKVGIINCNLLVFAIYKSQTTFLCNLSLRFIIHKQQIAFAIYKSKKTSCVWFIDRKDKLFVIYKSLISSLRFINCKQTAFAIYKLQIRYLRFINRRPPNGLCDL